MSYYDCHFDLIVRVEDPNGVELHDKFPEIVGELNDKVKEIYTNSVVFPKGFQRVEE